MRPKFMESAISERGFQILVFWLIVSALLFALIINVSGKFLIPFFLFQFVVISYIRHCPRCRASLERVEKNYMGIKYYTSVPPFSTDCPLCSNPVDWDWAAKTPSPLPIEDRISHNRKLPFDMPAAVDELLKYLHPIDLEGIRAIALVDQIKRRRMPFALSDTERDAATGAADIIISNELLREAPRMLLRIPLIAQFITSYALYHEVGRHVAERSGLTSEEEIEDSAYKYRQVKESRAFYHWCAVLVLPRVALLRWREKRLLSNRLHNRPPND